MPLPEPIKLDIFKSVVGPASQSLLQQMQNENPTRPFTEFYAMMEKTYGGDATSKNRRAWHNVKFMWTRKAPDFERIPQISSRIQRKTVVGYGMDRR